MNSEREPTAFRVEVVKDCGTPISRTMNDDSDLLEFRNDGRVPRKNRRMLDANLSLTIGPHCLFNLMYIFGFMRPRFEQLSRTRGTLSKQILIIEFRSSFSNSPRAGTNKT